MQISEAELRDMIRDAIARQRPIADRTAGVHLDAVAAGHQAGHASHALFATVASGDGDCIIEPTVRCNHCGYCKSYGH